MDWIENSYDPQQLFQRWLEKGKRAAIVGPHGSGKSTLLEFLVPLIGPVKLRRDASGEELPDADRSFVRPSATNHSLPDSDQTVVWLQLRKSCPPSMPIPWEHLHSRSTLVLDGYEQLNYFARIRILLRTQRLAIGLLVTAHRNTWLPTLCKLSVSAKLAKEIAEHLVRDAPNFKIPTEPELAKALDRNHGNLREVLMELYDEFEEQSR